MRAARGIARRSPPTPLNVLKGGPNTAATTRLVSARADNTSRDAELSFDDGSRYLCLALWLRDACRDAAHVEPQSERVLGASPLVSRLPLDVGIKSIHVHEEGEALSVAWDCGVVERSTFSAAYLRAFASRAAKQVAPPAARRLPRCASAASRGDRCYTIPAEFTQADRKGILVVIAVVTFL